MGCHGCTENVFKNRNPTNGLAVFILFSLQAISGFSESQTHNQKLEESELMSVSEAGARNSMVCLDTEFLIACPWKLWKTMITEK